jgi:acyl-CoA dehydrogenase family member 9
VRDLSHNFKRASKVYGEQIVSRQAVQARIADAAMWLHAWACTLSKLDSELRAGQSGNRVSVESANMMAALHLFDLAEHEIRRSFREIFDHPDSTMKPAADAAMKQVAQLPNSDYSIPEASPNAAGTGRVRPQEGIKQFTLKDEAKRMKDETRPEFQPSSFSLHPSGRTRM